MSNIMKPKGFLDQVYAVLAQDTKFLLGLSADGPPLSRAWRPGQLPPQQGGGDSQGIEGDGGKSRGRGAPAR